MTPAETIAAGDVQQLERLLAEYLEVESTPIGARSGGDVRPDNSLIQPLTEAYRASGHEEAVRKVVLSRLPKWAQEKASTGGAGNLVLHLGDRKNGEKKPRIAFVAHMEEIGYEVKKIEEDGRLQVDLMGGGYPQCFLGHVVLVHEKDGKSVGGVGIAYGMGQTRLWVPAFVQING